MTNPSNSRQTLAPKVLEFMSLTDLMYAMALAMLALAVMIAVLITRKALVRNQLNQRVSTLHLPIPSFEPSPEEVHRATRSLARSRPASWMASPKATRGVRVRLVTNKDGELEYRLEGPQSARSIIEGRWYSDVEVVPVKPTEGESTAEEKSPDGSTEEPKGEFSPGV